MPAQTFDPTDNMMTTTLKCFVVTLFNLMGKSNAQQNYKESEN
jgi:hypothetical protein